MAIAVTTTALDYIFPKLDLTTTNGRDYKTNDIIHRNIVVYGAQASGKTEFNRALAEKYVEKYGEDKATTILSRVFPRLISSVGWLGKPVQTYVWEDASLKKQVPEELAAFFNIRHIFQARTGQNKGIMITINNTHDLFAVNKKLRSSVDAIFFRSLPTNDYDIRIAKGYLGEDNFNKFSEIIKKRDVDQKLKGITYFNIRGEAGFVDWDLAKKNYMIDLDRPVDITSSFSTPTPNLFPLKIRLGFAYLQLLFWLTAGGYIIGRVFHWW